MGTHRALRLLPVLLLLDLACSGEMCPVDRPPTCRITAPEDGSSFVFGETLAVSVEASDPDGGTPSVLFFVDGALRLTDADPPFAYTMDGLTYRIGAHSLIAVARDDEGQDAADTIDVSITSDTTPIYGAKAIAEYPHDPGAFTQGLICEGGFFYEGTGLWGQSSIRKVRIETGEVLVKHVVPKSFFGEGIAILGEALYQLTWKSGTGFIYGVAGLDSIGSFSYETEGWGLTTDGRRLIMSDGTSTLYFLDPSTFAVAREVEVTDEGSPVSELNELEYVEGDIFANIWRRESPYRYRVARISPQDGAVAGWVEVKDIVDAHKDQGVLNGIGFDPTGRKLFVTGKNWDIVYEIELTF